jgi:hypothetical protein
VKRLAAAGLIAALTLSACAASIPPASLRNRPVPPAATAISDPIPIALLPAPGRYRSQLIKNQTQGSKRETGRVEAYIDLNGASGDRDITIELIQVDNTNLRPGDLVVRGRMNELGNLRGGVSITGARAGEVSAQSRRSFERSLARLAGLDYTRRPGPYRSGDTIMTIDLASLDMGVSGSVAARLVGTHQWEGRAAAVVDFDGGGTAASGAKLELTGYAIIDQETGVYYLMETLTSLISSGIITSQVHERRSTFSR